MSRSVAGKAENRKAARRTIVRSNVDKKKIGRTNVRSRPLAAVMDAARELWTKKADVELAARAGCSIRSAQYILAGRKGLTAEGLSSLLASDAGPRIFRALADDIPDQKILAGFRREAEAALLRLERCRLDRRLAAIAQEEG